MNARGPRHDDDEIHPRATLTVAQAAQMIGCGEKAVREGIKSGNIPHLKFGRKILIPRVALQKWIDSAGGTFPLDGASGGE
jgi:excisionase family DNA binding protein